MKFEGGEYGVKIGERTLHCSVYGIQDGFVDPVIYFHGYPGCRLEASLAHTLASQLGLTILAIDRPGFGGSSNDPGRTFVSFADDVIAVADFFKINTFSILAVSGGAPYGCACAYKFPDRVQKLVLVSGMGEVRTKALLREMIFLNRVLLSVGMVMPGLAAGCVGAIAWWIRAYPAHFAWWLRLVLRGEDRRAARGNSFSEMIKVNVGEALRPGVEGAVKDFSLLVQPWDFSIEEIKVPVSVWHGTADEYVPYEMGVDYTSRIPNAILQTIEGQGHFMIIPLLQKILRREFGSDEDI